jgi:hypothetical protein
MTRLSASLICSSVGIETIVAASRKTKGSHVGALRWGGGT